MVIRCPSCQRSLNLPADLVGQQVRCPTCANSFVAEEPAAPVEIPPPVLEPAEVEPGRPAGKSTQQPGKTQAIALMTLIGGIIAVLLSGVWTLGSGFVCCLWPGTYYTLVLGIMAIVRGSALLQARPGTEPAPQTIAIMQIVNIINGDVVNLVMGILTLVFLSEPEVKGFYSE
jgi:hypothetical protein